MSAGAEDLSESAISEELQQLLRDLRCGTVDGAKTRRKSWDFNYLYINWLV